MDWPWVGLPKSNYTPSHPTHCLAHLYREKIIPLVVSVLLCARNNCVPVHNLYNLMHMFIILLSRFCNFSIVSAPHIYRITALLPYFAFLAYLWGAYTIPVALSGVRRESSVVCRLCPP